MASNTTTAGTTTRVPAAELTATVNAAVASGAAVEVNGREVWCKWREVPAQDWNSGSVSVNVRGAARAKATQGTVWVKKDETAAVTVTLAGGE